MKLSQLNREAVDHALVGLGEIEHGKYHLPNMIDCSGEIAPSSIETRAFGQDRKQMRVGTPCAEQGGFLIPFTALADNRHGQQFTIRTRRRWARALIEMPNLLPDIVDQHIHPGDEVVKIGYHRCPPRAKG